jgi:hypothetical protein
MPTTAALFTTVPTHFVNDTPGGNQSFSEPAIA